LLADLVSFLNQLKSQANALQSQRGRQQLDLEECTSQTELACRTALSYLEDLARHLNVIEPAAPRFSLDGRTPWPAMQLKEFRVDARKKTLRNREVFDYVAIGWRILPRIGQPVSGTVSVNFPPDLERVQSRLAMGPVRHERKEVRHPEKNTLQAIEFEYITETRGNVQITPDHDQCALAFRLLNVDGFGIRNTTWSATAIRTEVMDDLARLIVSESSGFI
jgi:hypothetical protein